MTPLGKVVRTTAFRLSAIYLAVFSVFSVFFILYISYSTNVLLNNQVRDAIATELIGLSDQYRIGGAELGDNGRIIRRMKMFEHPRCARSALSALAEDIFHGDRQTSQRAYGLLLGTVSVDHCRVCKRPVRIYA